jgi:ParB family transcriptional regulator, chromosome partitioning protein
MNSSKPRKGALGRGLEAILRSPDTDITSADISGNYVAGAIAELEISKIVANPFQPRADFDEEALKELADSIKQQGVIQPVTVRKVGLDQYQLISGERRLRASAMAGLTSIPAYLRVANDEQMLEMALIENIHRENLNAIEIAISYQRLSEECKLNQDQLSQRLGKNRSTITNYLRLLKLPPEVQVALRDGHISMGHARALINLDSDTQRLIILQQIIEDDLNVRQVEALARSLNKPDTVEKANRKKEIIPAYFKEKIKTLRHSLNVEVGIRRNAKGKGALIINFSDDDEFDRLFDRINQ